jgi:hypothetical protein
MVDPRFLAVITFAIWLLASVLGAEIHELLHR